MRARDRIVQGLLVAMGMLVSTAVATATSESGDGQVTLDSRSSELTTSLTVLGPMRLAILSLSVVIAVLAAPCAGAETDRDDIPLAPDGHPDLSAIWDFSTLVPFERPDEHGDRTALSETEAAELEAKAAEAPRGPWSEEPATLGDDRRTSLIVDPPSGRLPAVQPGVELQSPGEDQEPIAPVRIRVGGIGADDPENRGVSERCLLGFNGGPPIVPGFYNQYLRIVQTADHVMLLTEMIHEARIVPLYDASTRPDPLPDSVRPWTGESVGHWDGDTLVIETDHFKDIVTGFSPSPFAAVGSAREMRLTERLRRLDRETLRYEFTVDDAATYVHPFTAVLYMKRTDERLYEYACHEGNHPLRHILQAARRLEHLTSEEAGDERP